MGSPCRSCQTRRPGLTIRTGIILGNEATPDALPRPRLGARSRPCSPSRAIRRCQPAFPPCGASTLTRLKKKTKSGSGTTAPTYPSEILAEPKTIRARALRCSGDVASQAAGRSDRKDTGARTAPCSVVPRSQTPHAWSRSRLVRYASYVTLPSFPFQGSNPRFPDVATVHGFATMWLPDDPEVPGVPPMRPPAPRRARQR